MNPRKPQNPAPPTLHRESQGPDRFKSTPSPGPVTRRRVSCPIHRPTGWQTAQPTSSTGTANQGRALRCPPPLSNARVLAPRPTAPQPCTTRVQMRKGVEKCSHPNDDDTNIISDAVSPFQSRCVYNIRFVSWRKEPPKNQNLVTKAQANQW